MLARRRTIDRSALREERSKVARAMDGALSETDTKPSSPTDRAENGPTTPMRRIATAIRIRLADTLIPDLPGTESIRSTLPERLSTFIAT